MSGVDIKLLYTMNCDEVSQFTVESSTLYPEKGATILLSLILSYAD